MAWDEMTGYRTAFIDWLACAIGGHDAPAANAARAAGTGLEGRILAAAAAGHVLDYDDTFLPGIAHLSAPTAPVALVLGAELGVEVSRALAAYVAGFEAMGALSRTAHPALYERGWHPTSVCGAPGAAVVASHLLELSEDKRAHAVRLALLSAGGLRAAFGSDAKALQVGFAAVAGVRGARLALEGATASAHITDAFDDVYGATGISGADGPSAISENWIKAYPCCLQTHGSIEAAVELSTQGVEAGEPVTAVVHPISRQAAAYDDVTDGLQAKFSIPYTVAFTLGHGPPGIGDFAEVDEEALTASKSIEVQTDASLLESEAVLTSNSGLTAQVRAATGSPGNPMTEEALAEKIRSLAGDRLAGALSEPSQGVVSVAAAAGLA